MAGLQRPEVPPGAQRDLVDALHALHHRAGWPSLRTLALRAGCSHTTVATVFSSPRLPSWGVLEVVVDALGGDVAEFHRLWLAASSPGAASEPRLAGRATELARVRRHLDRGSGLLLVTGEAGIGKTRLLDAAVSETSAVLVARGAGLPLSAQVPLLPVADVLRTVLAEEDGRWLAEAIDAGPPYVSGVLRRLLPELDEEVREPVDHPVASGDGWWRQRLFTGVATTWRALAAIRPFAVVIEDLHWADSTTLDLVEHLLTVGPGIPLVGTWRKDDPTVPASVRDWLTRVRRMSDVDELTLAPLTREETAEQLALLGGQRPTPSQVDRIYRRSVGQPLFTEQLAAQAGDDQPLPDVLADLLDRRLDGLDTASWRLARALGVADRPLSGEVLAAVTDLAPADLTRGLHELADRCLLAAATNRAVELRHPLLAEAIRRQLVGPEAAEEHRRLAIALADRTEPEPAEVAEHWRHADDPGQEIVWRIRAARTAALRFAAALESEQWLRVIELWPDDLREAGTPPISLAAVYVVAIDALKASMQFDRAIDVVAEAEGRLPDARIEDKAAILVRAADFRGARESADVGLALLEQALALYDELPLSEGHVHALDAQHNQLVLLGRFSEARQVATRAAQVAEAIGQAALHRQMLAIQAWHEADAGDVDRALRTATRAQALLPADVDPRGDIRIGVYVTDMLFRAGASAQEVEAAGARGLEAAATAGIESWQANLIRDNISQALIRAGLISRAATLIDPVTEGPYDVGHWPLHLERAHLDALRGLHAAARARMAPLRDDDTSMLYQTGMMLDRIDIVDQVALIDLWSGAPASALVLLHRLLDDVLGTTLANALGKALVLTARAAADLAEREGASAAERRTHLRDLMLRRRRGPEDLFATGKADDPALGAAWKAETARLAGEPSIPLWVAAAAEWDKLDRPCDAAYSRWRGAQAALEAGQGTVAQRMLRHAARQAREHVPLTTAIIETEARARPKGPA